MPYVAMREGLVRLETYLFSAQGPPLRTPPHNLEEQPQ
jgi:hypothetical protein